MSQIQTLLIKNYRRYEVESRFLALLAREGYTPIEPNWLTQYNNFRAIEHHIEDDKLVKLGLRDGLIYALRPDITSNILDTYVRYLEDDDILKVSYAASYIRQYETGFQVKPQLGFEAFGETSLSEHVRLIKTLSLELKKPIRLIINNPDYIESLISNVSEDVKTQNVIRQWMKTKNRSALENYKMDTHIKNVFIDAMSTLYTLDTIPNEAKRFMPYLELFSGFDFVIDLSLMPKYDYYNDLYIEGYIMGYAKALLTGGQYDKRTKLYGNQRRAFGMSFDIEILTEEVSV